MAKISQAIEALDRARGVNSGIDALVSLMAAVDIGPPKMADMAEILWAMHDQMESHLEEIKRCLDD